MAWTIDGIRIFAQNLKEETGQILPRLQPLSGGTVIQQFGHESDVRTLSCLVVGKTDKDAIKAFTQGTNVELVGPLGSEGNYEVKQVIVNWARNITCQTLRPDLADDSPVYDVEVQLYG